MKRLHVHVAVTMSESEDTRPRDVRAAQLACHEDARA